ncbi:hypothetical protein [Photorhabdus antumapuensis]|nr:hypothetical protein [Photorhabdus antumapuensis]MCA6221158.1 hypothetical protein [Photorhabdus antumapuensis]
MLSEQQLMNAIQYYYENRDGAMLSQGEGGNPLFSNYVPLIQNIIFRLR